MSSLRLLLSLLFLLLPSIVLALPPPTSNSFREAADLIRKTVNLSADPCEDFYNYACGNWLASNDIPPDMTSVSNFHRMEQTIETRMKDLLESSADTSKSKARAMVRTIYKKCVDNEALDRGHGKEMVKTLKRMGPWPMVEGNNAKIDPKKFDLTGLLKKVGHGVTPFIGIRIYLDVNNKSRRVLWVERGSLGLENNFYSNTTKYAKQIKAYKQYLLEKSTLLAEDYGVDVKKTALKADIEEIFKLEQNVTKIKTSGDEKRSMFNISKLSKLSSVFPIVDWPRYFKGISPVEVHSYIDSDPDIVFHQHVFFDGLAKLLLSTDPRTLVNYIMYRYSESIPLLFGSLYDGVFERYERDLLGKHSKAERWKGCINEVSSMMSHASSALYVEAHFGKKAKDTTLAMIADIKASFIAMLKESEWMDSVTKKEALAKAEEIVPLVGFDDWLLDDEKLDEWYEELDILPSDSLAVIIDKANRWNSDVSYRSLLEQIDRMEFTLDAKIINAHYHRILNNIVFPAAILQPPFFHSKFPKALNYGGIGSEFDRKGNKREWWQPETRKEFKKRTNCIRELYNNETILGSDLSIDGGRTLDENISDNGGIKAAFKAYKSYQRKNGEEPRLPGELATITNEQLFFLGYAQPWCQKHTLEVFVDHLLTDVHSLDVHRVDVVGGNQPEFAKAFSCPVGSRMNPVHRCSVW